MVYPKIYLLKPIKNAKPFPSHNHIPSSPAPYLCPPPACAGGWSSAVSPPGGSECVPQCSLLGGEGQAQLKTQKAPGTGSPDRMQEDEEEEEAERWSRTKQDTHINERWREVMEKQWLCTTQQQNVGQATASALKYYIQANATERMICAA